MDQSNARRAIEEAGARLGAALTTKNFKAAAALYTEDGQVLPPAGPIITGRGAIEEFWGQAVAALGLTSATLKTLEVTSSGDMAIEIGTAVLTTSTGRDNVKFMVAWRRGSDGVWRLHRDIWNGMPG